MRMMPLGIVICMIGFGFGCGNEDPTLMRSTQAELDEPAYQSWVMHDARGVVIDEGFELLEESQNRRLARSLRALTPDQLSLHPVVEDLLTSGKQELEIEVLVTVHSDHRLSRLPPFDRNLDPDDATNLEIQAQRTIIRAGDDLLRRAERLPVIQAIAKLGGEVTEEFRVGNALAVKLTIGTLTKLLDEIPQVVAVSPAATDDRPAGYELSVGRTAQISDPFVSAGYDGSGYRLGLVDTGVYTAHYFLSNPNDPILLWGDCVYSQYSDCSYYPYWPWYLYYNAGDPVSPYGHGTGMANILVGTNYVGTYYRGVADGAYLDSMNVYSGSGHTTLSSTAVLRAFNHLDGYDDIIVANVSTTESPTGTLATAANDLFDEGIVVLAPIDDGDYVKSPAIAHKVLGIGSYDATTGADFEDQAQGTYYDDRLKPDLTAPHNIYTASTAGLWSITRNAGNCQSTSFAGGAATLLRDYYDYRGWSSDPGAIYAAMITFGDEASSDLDDEDGAGNLELGQISNSAWISGVTYRDAGSSRYVYFYPPSGSCDVRAGIWWEQGATQSHNDMILYLNETGSTVDTSNNAGSVFEKVMHDGSLNTGTWYLKIYASALNPDDDVKVHYLIHYRTNC